MKRLWIGTLAFAVLFAAGCQNAKSGEQLSKTTGILVSEAGISALEKKEEALAKEQKDAVDGAASDKNKTEESKIEGSVQNGKPADDSDREHHDEKQPVKENPSGSSASKDESAGKEELPKEEPSEDSSEGMFEDEDAAVSHLEMGARSKYWQPVSRWLESQGNTDIGIIYNDLLQTDSWVYSEKELRSIPRDVLYVAKNEIFARHGYIFKNKDLNYYFRGMVWYRPTTPASGFDSSVLNEKEQENLDRIIKILG